MYHTTPNYGLIPRSIGGFFDDIFQHGFRFADDERTTATVPVNIRETEAAYEMEVVAPGLKKDDFKVSVERNVLTISYEQTVEKEEKADKWLRKEYRSQAFSRSFTLNEKIDASHIAAAYNDGVLSISLPKKETNMPVTQQIQIG